MQQNGSEANERQISLSDVQTEDEPAESTVKKSVYLCQVLPEEIERELNEDPDVKARCIDVIRTWILENKEFYGRTDESFILRFLRVSKFDVEKTKQRILKNYKVRHNYSNYFCRSEENEQLVEEIIGLKFVVAMNHAGNLKTNVLIANGAEFLAHLDKYEVDKSVCTVIALTSEIGLEDPRIQVNGVHYVLDGAGVTMEAMLHYTPAFIWRIMNMLALSTPVRIRGIHVLNMPAIANKMFFLFKFLLSKKLRSRLWIHKDLESLHQHIPPEGLAFEYGGSAGPIQMFVDQAIQLFSDGKWVNEKNKHYGINMHPQQSTDSDSDSSTR